MSIVLTMRSNVNAQRQRDMSERMHPWVVYNMDSTKLIDQCSSPSLSVFMIFFISCCHFPPSLFSPMVQLQRRGGKDRGRERRRGREGEGLDGKGGRDALLRTFFALTPHTQTHTTHFCNTTTTPSCPHYIASNLSMRPTRN